MLGRVDNVYGHFTCRGDILEPDILLSKSYETHRKKPRLPGIRRKVPTAVHTIGTAHAAPEVPELFYA